MAKIARKSTAQPKPEPKAPEVDSTVLELVKEFKDKFGRDPSVSLEAIQTMADQAEVPEDGFSTEQWLDAIRALETGEEKPVHVVSESAKELASLLVKVAGLKEDLIDYVDSQERIKRLPAQLGLYVWNNTTKEKRDALPIPGSEEGMTGNRQFDIPKKVGDPSYYLDVLNEMGSSIPYIKKIFTDIESVRGLKGPKPGADQKMYGQRKTNAVKALRAGVSICLRFDEIAETTKLKCGFRFDQHATEPKNTVERTTAPIWVMSADDPQTIQFFSVGAFLAVKMDVVRSTANDTGAKQMAAFKVERKPRTPKDQQTQTLVSIGTAEQYVDAKAEEAELLRSAAEREAIIKFAGGAGSDTFLLDLHDDVRFGERLLHRPAIAKRLDALLAERDKAAEAAEKAAA